MRKIRLYLFLLVTVSFFGIGKLYAQPAIYPVQLHVQLLPPFTPCLFDYVNDDYTRLRVIALQRDMREAEYQFSLQFTIKGNTMKIQTQPFKINYENNFKVSPGVATTISGRQLSNIFKSINNKQSLCLPEGYYELIFQAIDTKTNMPISEPSATFVYFQKGQPPFPIYPADGSCIKEEEGTTMIKFSWVDQTASMGLNKYYNLEVFEVRDDFAYQNIAQSQKADFSPTEKIMIPFYGMPVTAANFQKGKRYAWRVQVLNTQNDNKAAFKNNGYSEMFFFDYGTCINPFDALLAKSKEEDKKIKTLTEDIPKLLRIDTTNISASAVWKNEQKYNHFLVEYRRKDTLMERDWVVQSSLNTGEAAVADGAPDSLLLNGITREVVYEVRVQGSFKDGKFSQYSNILEFKLAREAVPECGNELPALSSTDKKNTTLEKDDIINANGYKVTITEITRNSDGTFSGYGKADAPILKLLPLRVKFDNITLNKENELMNGRIVTVHNPATSATFDLNGVLNKESRGKLLNEQGATIPKVDVNNLTNENYNSVVQDAEGNVYVVDSEGNKTKAGTINNNIAIEKGSRSANLGEIKFSVDQNMPFDEDAGAFKGKGFIEEHYQTLKENYQVPWTLVPTGQMREINAKISSPLKNGHQPKDVKFVCTDNVVLESKYNESDKTYTISVFGGDERTSQGVYAVVPEQPNNPNNRNYMTLGKILLAHYTEKTLDVVIVPVNEAGGNVKKEDLQANLNKIYNPIGVKVNVTVDEKFVVDDSDLDLSKGLKVDETKKWERETEEMRTLQRLYAQSGRELKKGTVYLFVLEKSNPANVQGDMPRDKRTGYIFGNEINNARLIAHELGHGAFTLEHTFNYGVAEKSTDNLMDYSDGSFLTCWQWYIAHNQNFVWSFMEDADDAMAWRAWLGYISWLGDWFGGFAPDNQEKEIDNLQSLLDHVHNNYANYHQGSMNQDVNITEDKYKDWSVRKSSHSIQICKSIYTKLTANADATFALHDKGIYVENYKLEEKTYQIAVYSAKAAIELKNDNIRLQGYKELADNIYIKAGYTKKYGIIVFYDNTKKFQMILQISGTGAPEIIVEQWLNYLAIVVATEKQEQIDKEIKEKLKVEEVHKEEKLLPIWNGTKTESSDIDVKNLKFYSQYATEISSLACHWCSSYVSTCCKGGKEQIKNEAGKLVCEDGGSTKFNNCCNATSQYMISQHGKTVGGKIKQADYFVLLVNTADCRDGVSSNITLASNDIIKKAKEKLKDQIPLMAGVFYEFNQRPANTKAPSNTDLQGNKCATNHFIVIKGYGVDKDKKEYFVFFDPASEDGANAENKLYFDHSLNLIKGKRVGDNKKSYILTEIRTP